MRFLVRHLSLVRVGLKHIINKSFCHSGSWSPVSFPWSTVAANLGLQPVCVCVYACVRVCVCAHTRMYLCLGKCYSGPHSWLAVLVSGGFTAATQ